MQYTKPALTHEQQVELLRQRGMEGDPAVMLARLRVVNYYRLSGYWHPFRKRDPAQRGLRQDSFLPGTSSEQVWRRYVFDRRLRLLVLDAIERVEVAVRSRLAYEHAHRCGDPFACATTPTAMPGLTRDYREIFLKKTAEQTDRRDEEFVAHFYDRYGSDHKHLPVWMAVELMPFGTTLTFYRGCEREVQRRVATALGVHHTVFFSWLLALNTVRNICAHHGRLWNRVLGTPPKLPERDAAWCTPAPWANDRVFCILTICRYCLKIVAPQSHWRERLNALLAEFPDVPQASMGFPTDWQKCPIWT